MPMYQRIVHTADRTVNDCTNEFLVVNASGVPKLKDEGFREVGRVYGLQDKHFIPQCDWIPNIPIVPVGSYTFRSKKQTERVKKGLTNLSAKEKLDKQALDLEEMIQSIVSAVPIKGNLYLIDYQYCVWDTKLHIARELFLVPNGEGIPKYKISPRKGLHLFNRHNKGDSRWTFIEPEASVIPDTFKDYPFKINDIKEVGEMEIAPVFLGKVRTSPRMKWTGISEYNPRLSRYTDFELNVKGK